jgi:DNA-directed RNA polymerase subunit RPC12/RpoP
MTKPAGSEYTCEECGGTFQRASDDAEANAEAARDFGVANASDDPSMAIVCDDCYRAMMAWRDDA